MADKNETIPLLSSAPPRIDQRAVPARRRWPFILFIALASLVAALILRWRRATVPEYIDHDFGVGLHLTYPYGQVDAFALFAN